VIIAAGGSGRRFGGSIPKQFLRLNGVPILQRAIGAFHAVRDVGEIVVVIPAAHRARVQRLVLRAGFTKVSAVVAGGKERQDSVWSGLGAFVQPPAIVLVHDAVRPLVTRQVILDVAAAARRHGAAVAGVPVKDTIKREGKKGWYTATLERKGLWAVQTPQGFRYRLLREAHVRARNEEFIGTDESSLVERMGIAVRVVQGDERNLKITTAGDLRIAGMWAKPGGFRV
jgi:2-C-methyl-D-erythritol 4-phosphate cytidylyltransferase